MNIKYYNMDSSSPRDISESGMEVILYGLKRYSEFIAREFKKNPDAFVAIGCYKGKSIDRLMTNGKKITMPPNETYIQTVLNNSQFVPSMNKLYISVLSRNFTCHEEVIVIDNSSSLEHRSAQDNSVKVIIVETNEKFEKSLRDEDDLVLKYAENYMKVYIEAIGAFLKFYSFVCTYPTKQNLEKLSIEHNGKIYTGTIAISLNSRPEYILLTFHLIDNWLKIYSEQMVCEKLKYLFEKFSFDFSDITIRFMEMNGTKGIVYSHS
jgi:hypothetical protein